MNIRLSPEQRDAAENLQALLAEANRRNSRRKFHRIFPDKDIILPDGSVIHARQKYPKHLEFFKAGATYRERCMMAANRVGKTFGSNYETTCHATGLYPSWWEGRQFDHPTDIWVAGKTNETTRDILQAGLFGDPVPGNPKGFTGTGMIPGDLIGTATWKQGIADLADVVKVKHVTGGWSKIGLKSYQQGRSAFEGTAKHVIAIDEEPPQDVYGECVIRTATTNGVIYLTFTPLEGVSKVVRSFLPQDEVPTAA